MSILELINIDRGKLERISYKLAHKNLTPIVLRHLVRLDLVETKKTFTELEPIEILILDKNVVLKDYEYCLAESMKRFKLLE